MIKVVCLKHGTKFDSSYVNKLKNMVKRHLSLPFEFWCFTDDANGIDQDVNIHQLPLVPHWLSGWWWKPYLFSDDLFNDNDTILFLDLDLVIIKSIDEFFDFEPGEFVGLRDVSRIFNPNRQKLGSAVMRWQAKTLNCIWEPISKDDRLINIYRGDQDYIWDRYKHLLRFFPDDWIRSYKWEIRNRRELVGKKENMRFETVIEPDVPEDCKLLVFHGYPTLDVVADPIIVDNWQ